MNNRLAMETLGGNTVIKRKISNLSVSLFKRDTVIKCVRELGVQMHSHSVMGELHLFLGVQLINKTIR